MFGCAQCNGGEAFFHMDFYTRIWTLYPDLILFDLILFGPYTLGQGSKMPLFRHFKRTDLFVGPRPHDLAKMSEIPAKARLTCFSLFFS